MTPPTVLITGAAGHLGRAVAATFAAQGARRVLLDRNAEALRQAFGADTAQQLCLSADLLDSGSTQQAVQSALGQMGQIDVLCHLAGGFGMGEPVHATPSATLAQKVAPWPRVEVTPIEPPCRLCGSD